MSAAFFGVVSRSPPCLRLVGVVKLSPSSSVVERSQPPHFVDLDLGVEPVLEACVRPPHVHHPLGNDQWRQHDGVIHLDLHNQLVQIWSDKRYLQVIRGHTIAWRWAAWYDQLPAEVFLP